MHIFVLLKLLLKTYRIFIFLSNSYFVISTWHFHHCTFMLECKTDMKFLIYRYTTICMNMNKNSGQIVILVHLLMCVVDSIS